MGPINRVFADDFDFSARHSGVFASGSLFESFSYGAAVVNTGQAETSRSFDDDASGGAGATDAEGLNSLGFYGRLRYSHDLNEDSSIMLGGDAARQNESPVLADVTKGNGSGAEATAYTVYAKLDYSDLEFLGSYLTGTWDNAVAGPTDSTIDGYYLQGSYKFRQFEPVIRYSYVQGEKGHNTIDYDELIRRSPENLRDSFGDELVSWYFGFSYYLMGEDLKFQGGYELAEGKDRAAGTSVDINGIRARIQLMF